MNESIRNMLEKLGYNVITNRSMTAYEVLEIFDMTIDEDGEIIDREGNCTGFYYDDIQF